MFLFSFWCISFLCANTATRQEPVQGFKWHNRKTNKQTTTTARAIDGWGDGKAGKFTTTHSPRGVDMNACSLLHLWLSFLTLAVFILLWNFF